MSEGGGTRRWPWWLVAAVVVAVGCVLSGGALLTQTALLAAHRLTGSLWFSQGNIWAWLLCALGVLLGFGAVRAASTFVTRMFRFVFKVAQSDKVTAVLAVTVNSLFLLLDGWLTVKAVEALKRVPAETLLTGGGALAYLLVFVMLACAFIWVPRMGVYGENAIAAALDEDRW